MTNCVKKLFMKIGIETIPHPPYYMETNRKILTRQQLNLPINSKLMLDNWYK